MCRSRAAAQAQSPPAWRCLEPLAEKKKKKKNASLARISGCQALGRAPRQWRMTGCGTLEWLVRWGKEGPWTMAGARSLGVV